MSTRMAASSIFRASALSTFDGATGRNVAWLEEGIHLRVKVNPWIGFPLHPFAAWRLEVNDEWHGVPIVWRDPAGKSLSPPFDLESVGGEAIGAVMGATVDDPWIWFELPVDNRGARVDLLDNRTSAGGVVRVVATRRESPFRFGNSEISHLRASGAGTVFSEARGIRISDLFIDRLQEQTPDLIFGLPLPSESPNGEPLAPGPWFAPDPNLNPRDAAALRVADAAPRRLNPPDNPNGSMPDDTDPNDEADRIINSIAPSLIDPWLFRAFGDPNVAPSNAVRDEFGTTDKNQTLKASAPVTPTLLTMAVDPQIARYLGLATLVRYDETPPIRQMNVWVIASRWAVQRNRTVLRFDDLYGISLTLDAFLGSATPPGSIDAALDAAFPDAAAIIADIPNRPDPDKSGPWSVVTLLAVAVAAGEAPPDAPDTFSLSAFEPGIWNAHDNPQLPGLESWRQPISLGDKPARGMIGFARMAPGNPLALHRVEPPPGQGFVSRALPLVPNWASNNRRLVTDREIPPDQGGANWQVWQADDFGQWSEAALLALPLPKRPSPPPPLPEATYEPAAADGSTGPRIPGRLRLRYEVPGTAHAAPGSLPIVELQVTVDGAPLPPISVSPGETLVLEAAPAPFNVGEHREVPVTSTYFDSDGNPSPPEPFTCAVFDARAPRVIPTSPVVIWTGQPDATGQAELVLRWPPRQGASRYRVYLGDARRLAGGAGVALPSGPVRSVQAKPIHDASTSLVTKTDFTFLGEILGTADGDGTVHFRTRIPGSLRSIQFVRIVPLTQGGAEADFPACGLVPIAVPAIDRPPTPALDAETDPATGLTLMVRALGLRADLLASAPGGVPQFRLRRTRRQVTKRMYIPVRETGVLAVNGEGLWTAIVTIPVAELDPFVRTTWLAEVRYPAEPPIPPGMAPLPVAGGVEPVWSTVGASAEGVWSDPSLVAVSLLIPPDGPAAPAAPTLTVEANGSTTVTMTGLPSAHPAAIAPYHLEVYRGTPGTASKLVGTKDLAGDGLTWTDPTPAPAGVHYDLVVVDPIGRRSPPTRA